MGTTLPNEQRKIICSMRQLLQGEMDIMGFGFELTAYVNVFPGAKPTLDNNIKIGPVPLKGAQLLHYLLDW